MTATAPRVTYRGAYDLTRVAGRDADQRLAGLKTHRRMHPPSERQTSATESLLRFVRALGRGPILVRLSEAPADD